MVGGEGGRGGRARRRPPRTFFFFLNVCEGAHRRARQGADAPPLDCFHRPCGRPARAADREDQERLPRPPLPSPARAASGGNRVALPRVSGRAPLRARASSLPPPTFFFFFGARLPARSSPAPMRSTSRARGRAGPGGGVGGVRASVRTRVLPQPREPPTRAPGARSARAPHRARRARARGRTRTHLGAGRLPAVGLGQRARARALPAHTSASRACVPRDRPMRCTMLVGAPEQLACAAWGLPTRRSFAALRWPAQHWAGAPGAGRAGSEQRGMGRHPRDRLVAVCARERARARLRTRPLDALAALSCGGGCETRGLRVCAHIRI